MPAVVEIGLLSLADGIDSCNAGGVNAFSKPADDSGGDSRFPWFWAHYGLAVGLSVVLFICVAVALYFAPSARAGLDILFLLPIALLAMTFGVRGGVAGAVVGCGLLAVGKFAGGGAEISISGWIVRGTVMFALGILLGVAADQINEGRRREAEAHQKRLLLWEKAHQQAEAIEIFDSVLQGVTAAKWSVEAGHGDEAVAILSSTLEVGQQLVADQLGLVVGGFDARAIEEGSYRASNQSGLIGDFGSD
jgi:hypothetical protein